MHVSMYLLVARENLVEAVQAMLTTANYCPREPDGSVQTTLPAAHSGFLILAEFSLSFNLSERM
jgi:hypothetical protein